MVLSITPLFDVEALFVLQTFTRSLPTTSLALDLRGDRPTLGKMTNRGTEKRRNTRHKQALYENGLRPQTAFTHRTQPPLNRVFAEKLGQDRFLAFCFLYQTNPNPRRIICCAKKVAQMPLLT